MNKRSIKKYYDKRSACQVLGVLMLDPQKVKSRDYQLTQRDFSVDVLHNIIFTCIYNLAYQGAKEIGLSEIEGYLSIASPADHTKVFDKLDGAEWITKVLETANSANFDYHYGRVKKLSLLRSYLEQGIDITYILDKDEVDPNIIKLQEEKLESMSLEDIIREIDLKHLNAKRDFVIRDESDRRKAGDGAEELRESMKKSPVFGLGLESEYLNTVIRGALGSKFVLETRDTGNGKTRLAMKRLLGFTAPYLWDYKKQDFVPNPNGQGKSALYIGTEMDLYLEMEPMMWAIVSGVEEDKIKNDELTSEEEARVDRAIKILKDTDLFLENEPNFDNYYLWQTIEEYKVKHDICAVVLDYIEMQSGLINEYKNLVGGGMMVREDQVLLNLSNNLKNIANEYDIWVNSFTQTTEEARRDGRRDQGAVKGARSLPNKADAGIVVFEPNRKELEKVEPIIRKLKGLNEMPNVYYSFYKNRGEKYKEIKIWGYQNLGNGYFQDLFCTNKYYEPINIKKTKIKVVDDKVTTF